MLHSNHLHRLLFLAVALLVAALLMPLVAVGQQPPLAAGGSPSPAAGVGRMLLETALDDTSATVRGPHFALHWSAASGGDLTSIRIDDGTGWREILGRGRIRHSMPGLRLVTAAGDYRPLGPGRLRWLEEGGERAVLEVETTPTTPDGRRGPFHLRQVFTIYAEGAVFIDFVLELPAGAAPVEIQRASIGWSVATDGFDETRWHWRRSPARGGFYLDSERAFRTAPAPNSGLALARNGEFTNHLQFVLERSQPVGESTMSAELLVSGGSYFIYHLRSRSAGPDTLTAPFRYANRCGILLGRAPVRDPLHGQRLVYWTEGGASGMAFPSASALEAMTQCGASGVVLGPGWRRASGLEGNQPVDQAAMTSMIAEAHDMGLAVLAYVVAQGDPIELGRWAQQRGLDGLYLDQTSPHLGLIREEGHPYPARAAFEWAHQLRRELGPEAILIGQAGVAGPDLCMALVVPGVAYGEQLGDEKAANSPMLGFYLGGQGYGIPCPQGTAFRLRNARSLAMHAASGAVPLVPLGHGAERSAYQGARWVLPLWQMYRTLPMGTSVEALGGNARDLVVSDNPRFRNRLYQLSDDALLLVSANLSRSKIDSTFMEVRYDALGMSGAYAIEQIRPLGLDSFESLYLGRSSDGQIHTEPIGRWGLRGYLFVRGDYPPAVGRALDDLAQLDRAFADQRAPAAPGPPTVTAGDLALRVEWEPVHDRHHVEAYQIYRSPSAEFDSETLEDLGLVYETTRFRDPGVVPGERWFYSVVGIDQAGNLSVPSRSTAGELPARDRLFTFDEAAEAERFTVLSGSWQWYEGAFEHGRRPDASRFARVLLEAGDYPDVDLRVRIDSPGNYQYAGGVLFRANDAGDGYVLFLGNPQHSRLVLAVLEGQRERRIAEAHYPYVTLDGGARTLRVTAEGDRIIARCDDRVLIDVEDTSCRGRRVGLMANQGHVRFDNLSVEQPGARP